MLDIYRNELRVNSFAAPLNNNLNELGAYPINPFDVTVKGCDPAPAGTVTVSWVEDAVRIFAFTFPNQTWLPEALAANPEPLMVNVAPTLPDAGEKLLITGCANEKNENNIKPVITSRNLFREAGFIS
jgi:hypothetical protein